MLAWPSSAARCSGVWPFEALEAGSNMGFFGGSLRSIPCSDPHSVIQTYIPGADSQASSKDLLSCVASVDVALYSFLVALLYGPVDVCASTRRAWPKHDATRRPLSKVQHPALLA